MFTMYLKSGNLFLLIVVIGCSQIDQKSTSGRSKVTPRFPCISYSNSRAEDGFCVPKRECCSTKGWRYNSMDFGNCGFKQLCCVDRVLCQSCPNGTRDKNHTCIDINECEETYGLCSGQKCLNLNGSYTCVCSEGYRIVGEPKTCQPINGSKSFNLLFSASLTINLLTLNPRNRMDHIVDQSVAKSPIRMVYSGTVTPQSLDYSYDGNYMAWVDSTLDQINMAAINDMEPSLVAERSFPRFAKKPNSLAIDWVHDLLYWTDLGTRSINVVNVKKPFDEFVVVNASNQEPHDLVINIFTNSLLWTNVGHKPKIMHSFQDGSNQTILFSNHKQIFCLTIDMFIKRYYFLDIEFALHSIDFEGRDERKILWSPSLLSDVNSMSVYYDDIFMSTNSLIYRINKFGHFERRMGERAEALVASLTPNQYNESFIFRNTVQSRRHQLFNAKIVDPVIQPRLQNKCELAKCSHICVPSDSKTVFRCLCPPNTILVENSVCAEKRFENMVVESLFWENDLKKLIEHSIAKSVTLRQLLNQSFAQQIDLKQLFRDSFDETMKIRQLFNLTTRERNEMKRTFVESINETLFWKRVLNTTFNNKHIFEKLLNQTFYTKNFTEIIQFVSQSIEEEEETHRKKYNKARVSLIVIAVFALIGIITIIALFSYIAYKLRKFRSNGSALFFKPTQTFQNPTYDRRNFEFKTEKEETGA